MKYLIISDTLGMKMTIKEQINNDIKTAMLAGDKDRVTILRGLKSAILYAEVAKGVRDEGLPENEIVSLLQKEAKKRQESAELYRQGGNSEKADAEAAEKKIIETYLPAQLTEEEISALIKSEAKKIDNLSLQSMGQLIGGVKQASGGNVDGAIVARLVREYLAQ